MATLEDVMLATDACRQAARSLKSLMGKRVPTKTAEPQHTCAKLT